MPARDLKLECPGVFAVNVPVIRLALLGLLSAGCLRAAAGYAPSNVSAPPVVREFRGVWVATLNNIDWPSKRGLPTEQQKQELIALLDKCAALRLNVVILQVRPGCDALYASKLEPWSEYLTGVPGQAPSPFWDPLEFAVAEAHRRGLELHAWFNPFRARHSTGSKTQAASHVTRTHPEWVRNYGPQQWLDPGLAEVHDHSARVILDVVRRYDVDGVHIDDYFYPYPEPQAGSPKIPFPDHAGWAAYQQSGGKLARDDWRRDNVNRFIARMYREVHAAKPWVKVGISPFGIYRPGQPASVRGLDQFAALYADPKVWLANGWLDYLAPQLYWRIDAPGQSFPALLKWWAENNPRQRVIAPGLNVAAIKPAGGSQEWNAAEIIRQVEMARQQSGVSGHIHWNMGALVRNRDGVGDKLLRQSYPQPALVPAMLGNGTSPVRVLNLKLAVSGGNSSVTWASTNAADVRFWVAQWKAEARWQTRVLPPGGRLTIPGAPEAVSVRALDRAGRLGESATLRPDSGR